MSNTKWLANVGLEIHAQISSASKLFSGASTQFGGPPNSQVAYFDAALPGTLPSLNRKCAELGVKASLALNCKLNYRSRFDRKHYFYADLPSGYQITQHDSPLARDGYIDYVVSAGRMGQAYFKRSRIVQIQLEQDSGRSFHDPHQSISLIDLNRAGVGLLELITEPNLESGVEASCLVKELAAILQSLSICTGEMQKGHLRVDANISIRRPEEDLGVRSEVKNINSFNHIKKAIEFEIERHIQVKERGEEIVNETRMFDLKTGETSAMRDKEMLQDYRFLPEPNLPCLFLFDIEHPLPAHVTHKHCIDVDVIRNTVHNVIASKRTKLIDHYKLALKDAAYIMDNDNFDAFFESCLIDCPPESAGIVFRIMRDFEKFLLTKMKTTLEESKISAKDIGSLAKLVYDGKLTFDTAMVALIKCSKDGKMGPLEFVEQGQLWAIHDPNEMKTVAANISNLAPKLLINARAGGKGAKEKLLKLIRNHTKGRISLENIREIVEKWIKQ